MTRLVALLTMTLLWAGGASAAPTQSSALELVKQASEEMLAVLEARHEEIEANPRALYGLVERIVLPHFDFERITRGAVGRYWQRASSAQRQALIRGFREVLVRTYASALTNYSGQAIEYLPLRTGPGEERVTVPTKIRNAGGSQIAVDYRLRGQDSRWKVYDVVIDDVSLVANYRNSFATIIRDAGIDGLIDRLEQKNASGQG